MSFRCPTLDDVLASLLALLPRGRAWQTHDGSPRPGAVPGFAPSGFSDGFATDSTSDSILWRFWRSVADVFFFLNQRLCDLRMEFWCHTQRETRDQWMTEYGLPDACDPFPDLCAKVAAIGGTRCEYYQSIAARAGWRLFCFDGRNICGARPGSARAKAGCARPGRAKQAGYLYILVDFPNSPAASLTFRNRKPKAGHFKAGKRLSCSADAADFAPIECLLARVVHAEIQIIYEAL